jgi:hypothetical protein
VSGVIIGKYALDDAFYSEYTEAAFALSDGEVSSLIEIKGVGDNYSDGYYVLVGVEKDDKYFDNHKDEIEIAYVDNYIGKLLKEAKQALIPSARFSNDYTSDIVTNLIGN